MKQETYDSIKTAQSNIQAEIDEAPEETSKTILLQIIATALEEMISLADEMMDLNKKSAD